MRSSSPLQLKFTVWPISGDGRETTTGGGGAVVVVVVCGNGEGTVCILGVSINCNKVLRSSSNSLTVNTIFPSLDVCSNLRFKLLFHLNLFITSLALASKFLLLMNPNRSITKSVQYLENLEVVGKLNSDDESYENIYLLKKKDTNQMYVQKTASRKKFNFLELYVHDIMRGNSHFISLHTAVFLPDSIFWVMDYIKDGDLYDLVKNSRYKFDETKCRKIILQLVNALNELHKKKIIHNDIKLENLLYSVNKHRIYVADYGLAHIIGTPSLYDGTSVYFSPEKIKEEVNQESFDWWAVGVVTYEILSKRYPYKINEDETKDFDTNSDVMNGIEPQNLLPYLSRKLPRIKSASPIANDFVQRMLQFDITKRLHTYNDIIRHPFLCV
ncbi:ORF3 [Agrotis segetum granulovirus]|uniref:non-specific serine/threonine protein kinase n=1 Tax=Agrotis segetum granulosis virus TaxID=10464 RepID=Q6QXC2_GVAS|nr:pk1 [Agrotis segetum granulovirus]AAS82735.1 ORF3 [Agrotis segetum granulovirus]AHN92041.1 pk-1 [Agrotis segetum granulovirus]AKN63276.1 pk1 [Agrotis segetum granulovirus]